MKEDTWSTSRWRGGWGRGFCILKIVIAKGGVQFSYVMGGGGILIHHTFLTSRPGRNKRSAPFKILLQYPHHYFVTLLVTKSREKRVKRTKKQK